MLETISIPERFNGPLHSGNGGYCAGVIAERMSGFAEVSLRRPVPLGRQLELSPAADGSLRVLDGEEVVCEAEPASAPGVDAVPLPAVSLEQARRARERYRGPSDGLFSSCFVCGLAREDSMEVFAGPVEGRDLVASPWMPPEWTAGEDGRVRPEFVWAVLDCPTYFACYREGPQPLSFLVRLGARIVAPVQAEQEQVVIAWPAGSEGRKRHAGSAVLSAAGEVLAVARALMVEPR
jgi:hypothetical protein